MASWSTFEVLREKPEGSRVLGGILVHEVFKSIPTYNDIVLPFSFSFVFPFCHNFLSLIKTYDLSRYFLILC